MEGEEEKRQPIRWSGILPDNPAGILLAFSWAFFVMTVPQPPAVSIHKSMPDQTKL
jgi:hypothetical protein